MSEEETDYGVWPKKDELVARMREMSRSLRNDMERLLPSPNEQAAHLEALIEIAGQPTTEMVLVPRKPTKAMLRAAEKAMSPGKRPTQDWMSVREKHRVRYEAMIAAYLEESDE